MLIFFKSKLKQFDSTSLQEMHLKLEEQIKRGLESKTFSDIEKARIQGRVVHDHRDMSADCHWIHEKARELIRAEERIKFEQKLILERNEAEDKIRTLREEVLKKDRRLHEDIKIRSDDIDRQSYNQRDRFKILSQNPRSHKLLENFSNSQMSWGPYS